MPKLEFKPAVQIKRHYIISSDFTGKKPFIPKFLYEKEQDIDKLLSMEYGRMWFLYLKEYRTTLGEGGDKFRPGIILKTPVIKKIKHLTFDDSNTASFTMSRFKNVKSRTDHRRADTDPQNTKPAEDQKSVIRKSKKKTSVPEDARNVSSGTTSHEKEIIEEIPPFCTNKCPMYCTGHKKRYKRHSCLSSKNPPKEIENQDSDNLPVANAQNGCSCI